MTKMAKIDTLKIITKTAKKPNPFGFHILYTCSPYRRVPPLPYGTVLTFHFAEIQILCDTFKLINNLFSNLSFTLLAATKL